MPILFNSTADPIQNLKSNQEGYAFSSALDLQFHLQVYVASVISFITINRFWKFLFEHVVSLERYQNLSEKYERPYFVSLLTANVHHFTVSALAIYTFVYPDHCSENYPLAWFYDLTCRVTVNPTHVSIVMLTLG